MSTKKTDEINPETTGDQTVETETKTDVVDYTEKMKTMFGDVTKKLKDEILGEVKNLLNPKKESEQVVSFDFDKKMKDMEEKIKKETIISTLTEDETAYFKELDIDPETLSIDIIKKMRKGAVKKEKETKSSSSTQNGGIKANTSLKTVAKKTDEEEINELAKKLTPRKMVRGR